MPKTTTKTDDIKVRMMPHNFEAEQALLGSVLLDESSTISVFTKIKPEDFYSETHQKIYESMLDLFVKNTPIDFVTLADELEKKNLLTKIGGVEYLSLLSETVPSSANYEHYLDIVKRDSVGRSLITVCEKIVKQSYEESSRDGALNYAEKEIFSLAESGQVSALEQIKPSLDAAVDKFEKIQKNAGEVRGIPCGFHQMDEIMNGMNRGDLIIIAARPSVGKTSLAMNMVTNAALGAKAKCAVFSLEMPKIQLAERMICSVAGVGMEKGKKGTLTKDDWRKIFKAKARLAEAEIFVDDSSLNTPGAILSKCRKLKRERGLDLVMIDYLQLMSSEARTDSRQNEISDISRRMKILAKEIDVPVLLLSQLSRAVESRQGHKPVLSDLRESGAIEQDADIVAFIHKPDRYEDLKQENKSGDFEAEIIFAKNRNGQCKSAFLGWKGETTSFVNLSRDANLQSALAGAPPAQVRKDEIPSDENVLPFEEAPLPEFIPPEDIDSIFYDEE